MGRVFDLEESRVWLKIINKWYLPQDGTNILLNEWDELIKITAKSINTASAFLNLEN